MFSVLDATGDILDDEVCTKEGLDDVCECLERGRLEME